MIHSPCINNSKRFCWSYHIGCFNQPHPHCIEMLRSDKLSIEASTSPLSLTLKNACLVNSINRPGALPSNLIQECHRHEWVIKALFQDKRPFPARKKKAQTSLWHPSAKKIKRIVIKGSVSVVNFTELNLMQNSCGGVTSEKQFINPTYVELVGSSHGTLRSYEYSPGLFGFLFRTPFVNVAEARKVFWTRSSLLLLSLPHIFSHLSHSRRIGAKWSMMSLPSDWSKCNAKRTVSCFFIPVMH